MQIRNIIKCADLFYKRATTRYWGKKASGVIYMCLEDNTILLLKRSDRVEQPGTWGVAGGAIGEGFHSSEHEDDEETQEEIFLSSAEREAQEELGSLPQTERLLNTTEFRDKSFVYKTYIYNITLAEKERWTPQIRLNWENDEAQWFPMDNLPAGLHFGLQYSLNSINRSATTHQTSLLRLGGRWNSIISGEWWITSGGQELYADQDVGDVGHEALAADYLMDKDILLEGLKEADPEDAEWWDEKYGNDDDGASSIFFNERIPDQVGIAASGGNAEKWRDINKDIRLAFVKWENAIMAINTDFWVWRLDESAISRIQNFIMDQVEEISPQAEDEVTIEEASTKNRNSMPLGEFLGIKYPAEFWRVKQSARLRNLLKIASYDPESWYYYWEPGVTLQTIIDRWQKQRPGKDKWGQPMPRQKMYDASMPLMISVDELWPLREYTWTRENARRSPEEWDQLMQEMKTHGWNPTGRYPLLLNIGAEGGVKVGEGNHRLAIAKQLGIKEVPVNILFSGGKVTKNKQRESRPTLSSHPPEQPNQSEIVDPEHQAQVDELLHLLGKW